MTGRRSRALVRRFGATNYCAADDQGSTSSKKINRLGKKHGRSPCRAADDDGVDRAKPWVIEQETRTAPRTKTDPCSFHCVRRLQIAVNTTRLPAHIPRCARPSLYRANQPKNWQERLRVRVGPGDDRQLFAREPSSSADDGRNRTSGPCRRRRSAVRQDERRRSCNQRHTARAAHTAEAFAAPSESAPPARLMHCKGRGRLRADRSVSPVPSLSAPLSWESTLSLHHSRSTAHRQFKEPFSLPPPAILPARRPQIRNDVPPIINQVESAQLGARDSTGFIHMIMMTGGKEKITQCRKERKEAGDQSVKHAANLCARRGAVAPTDLCALYERCTGGRTKKEASARCNAAPRSPDKIVPPVSRPAAAANRWVTLGRNGGPRCPNRVGPQRQCTALGRIPPPTRRWISAQTHT